MLRNIEKILADGETILSVTTESDFEYNYRLQDICRIETNIGEIVVGEIITIEDNYLEIKVKNKVIINLSYSCIEGLEKAGDKDA